MSDIMKWTDRCTNGKFNFASFNEARDAEISDLRARILEQDRLLEAANLRAKVNGLDALAGANAKIAEQERLIAEMEAALKEVQITGYPMATLIATKALAILAHKETGK